MIRPAPTRISVIVPVYNAAATLPLALEHLAAQDYEGDWELVLVDNRSTDASAEVCRGWLDRFGSARLVEALDDQGVSHARNVGVAASTGDFIAICDADDAADPGWLSAMAEGARYGDVVAGVCLVENELNEGLGYRPENPKDWKGPLQLKLGYLPFAPGGSCGMWRDVVEAVGGWDETIRLGGDDIDFSWRAQRAGYRLHHEPRAVIQYRLRPGLRALARQRFHYGRGDALLADRYAEVLDPSEVVVCLWPTVVYLVRLALSVSTRRTPLALGLRYGGYRVGRLVGAWRYGRRVRW